MKPESSEARRPLRPWDFMGRRGLNVRNPRRIAVEDGEIACLACLRSGRFATPHDGHSPQHPPDSMPRQWLVSETPRWGELPLGTTLTLMECADSSFVDETGPNSSVDRTFLYVALDGSAAGQFFQISTSVAASDSEASGFPSFLMPVDALTQTGVQALVNRPWPASCRCGAFDGAMHTPGQGGEVHVCIHDLLALSAHLAPFAAARVRDPSWVRLFANPGRIPCECECGCRAATPTAFRADQGPGFLCIACDKHQPPAQGDGWEIFHRPALER
jgi:hypothetical protein